MVGAGATSATDPDPGLTSTVAFLTIRGETQGDIEGGVRQAGREGSIAVTGVRHDIESPRDAASGLPTGKRQHSPLVVLKQVDKSTPLLYHALANNESLTEVSLKFYRTVRDGKEQQYYTIDLTNASIASIKLVADTETAGNLIEEISLTYQKITWTWQDGGITAEDDWETPVS